MATIDHAALWNLAEAGSVRSARAVAQEGGWAVTVRAGGTERTLIAQRGRQVRLFRRFETLVAYLKSIGISQFDVDADRYDATASRRASRPDRADALKRAHAAVGHDQWFRREVELGLAEANDVAARWIDHDDAKERWAAERIALLHSVLGTKA